MKKEEAMKEVNDSFLKPLAFTMGICLIALISTPFVWMWFNWTIAWRVGLSGLMAYLITLGLYKLVEQAVEEVVDEEIEKNKPAISKFQEKLEKAMEKNDHQRYKTNK